MSKGESTDVGIAAQLDVFRQAAALAGMNSSGLAQSRHKLMDVGARLLGQVNVMPRVSSGHALYSAALNDMSTGPPGGGARKIAK